MLLPLTLLRPPVADLPLDRAEVLRYLRYRPGRTQIEERHHMLVDEGIALAMQNAVPAVSLAYCAVDRPDGTDDLITTRVPGLTWRSRSLVRLLDSAVAVTLVAATLGDAIEAETARLFKAEEYALATVVDAAGSELVQALGRHALAHLASTSQGYELTPLYGPGYGDWPIEDQIALIAAAGGEAIGLRSTPTCYLVPQKSLAGVVGWLAADAARRRPDTGCALCTMPGCAFRVRGN